MPFLQALMTVAQPMSAMEAATTVGHLLCHGEVIATAYDTPHSAIVFTTRRLVLVQKHHVSRTPSAFHSASYDRIVRFSLIANGFFDLDARLRIWVSGQVRPFDIFCDCSSACAIQELLAQYAMPTVAVQPDDSQERDRLRSSRSDKSSAPDVVGEHATASIAYQYVSNQVSENKDWLYEEDSETVSPEGLVVLKYIAQSVRLGMTQPKLRWEYACDMLERDLLNDLRDKQGEGQHYEGFMKSPNRARRSEE